MAGPPTSYCPNCLAEYRPGFDTCADCGVRLVRGPAPVTEEHAPAGTRHTRTRPRIADQVPVVLATLPRLEAQLLAGKLQAEGLVASADEPALMSAYGGALPESPDDPRLGAGVPAGRGEGDRGTRALRRRRDLMAATKTAGKRHARGRDGGVRGRGMFVAAHVGQRSRRHVRPPRPRLPQGAVLPVGLHRVPHGRRRHRTARRRSAGSGAGDRARGDRRTGWVPMRRGLQVKVAFHVDQLWFSAPGGIGTYVREMLDALPAADPSLELVRFRSRWGRSPSEAPLTSDGRYPGVEVPHSIRTLYPVVGRPRQARRSPRRWTMPRSSTRRTLRRCPPSTTINGSWSPSTTWRSNGSPSCSRATGAGSTGPGCARR